MSGHEQWPATTVVIDKAKNCFSLPEDVIQRHNNTEMKYSCCFLVCRSRIFEGIFLYCSKRNRDVEKNVPTKRFTTISWQ